MSKVKLYFSNRQNKFQLPNGLKTLARRCCETVLEEEKIDAAAEISLTIVDDDEIKELNGKYRGKNYVTDVLSFPMGESGDYDINPDTGCLLLGDIVISAEKAAQQAKEYGHSFEREFCFLTVHSALHLLGYDHEINAEQEKIMFDKQKNILTKAGLPR